MQNPFAKWKLLDHWHLKLRCSPAKWQKQRQNLQFLTEDLISLSLPREKSFFVVLVLMIGTQAQSFFYWNSRWIELGEAKPCGLRQWKNMLRVGIMGFGRNRTEYGTQLYNAGSRSYTSLWVLQASLQNEWDGGCWGCQFCTAIHLCHILCSNSFPSIPACPQTTPSKGLYDLCVEVLLFPTKVNAAPSSRGKTLRLWQPADTHDRSAFPTQNS